MDTEETKCNAPLFFIRSIWFFQKTSTGSSIPIMLKSMESMMIFFFFFINKIRHTDFETGCSSHMMYVFIYILFNEQQIEPTQKSACLLMWNTYHTHISHHITHITLNLT